MKPQGNLGWTNDIGATWTAPGEELGGTDGAKTSCLQRMRFSSSQNEHPVRPVGRVKPLFLSPGAPYNKTLQSTTHNGRSRFNVVGSDTHVLCSDSYPTLHTTTFER